MGFHPPNLPLSRRAYTFGIMQPSFCFLPELRQIPPPNLALTLQYTHSLSCTHSVSHSFTHLFIHLPSHPFTYLPPIHTPIHLSTYLAIQPSTHPLILPIHPPLHKHIYIHLCIHLFAHLPPTLHPSTHLSTHPFIQTSIKSFTHLIFLKKIFVNESTKAFLLAMGLVPYL